MGAVTGRLDLASALLVVIFFAGLSFAQTPASCDDQGVRYAPFDVKFAKRHIRIAALESTYQQPTDLDKQFSPQHTMWFVKADADFTKPGPWNSSLIVGARPKGKAFRLTFIGESNNAPTAEWLNEKLLFIQVWWARMISTDMIFDVEKRQFLYQETASYFEMAEPCQ